MYYAFGGFQMIIDCHTHIFPDKIETIAVHAIGDFYSQPMVHHGKTAELLESCKSAGVDKCLVFSTATTTHQVPSINNYIISECSANKEFIGAGTMHPDYDNFEEELEKLEAGGVHGIKLHPDFQKVQVDDKRLMRVYAAMEKRGMFVITHSGDPRYDYSTPSRVAHVAKEFPKLKIIAAHFGGWMCWENARKELVLPNVYVDTSSVFGFGGLEPVLRALETFDHKKILFGTDFPMWDQKDELAKLRALGLDKDFLDDILGRNFINFYGREL